MRACVRACVRVCVYLCYEFCSGLQGDVRTEDGVKAVFDKVLEDECHGCQHVVAAIRGNTSWWEVVTAGLIPQDLYLLALVVCSCSVLHFRHTI